MRTGMHWMGVALLIVTAVGGCDKQAAGGGGSSSCQTVSSWAASPTGARQKPGCDDCTLKNCKDQTMAMVNGLKASPEDLKCMNTCKGKGGQAFDCACMAGCLKSPEMKTAFEAQMSCVVTACTPSCAPK